MLDMPPARVRELAREALSSLAPSSARRVDGEWRNQVADYVLGQQTGPESKATRGHLKHSEPARTWVSSLVDSLDSVYGDADRPEIPEPDKGGAPPASRRGKRGTSGKTGAAAGAGAAAGVAAGAASGSAKSGGPRGRTDRPKRGATGAGATRETAGKPDTSEHADGAGRDGRREQTTAPSGGLSPEARKVVRRRRIVGGALAVAVVAIVLAIVLTSGGDDEPNRASSPPPPRQQQGPQAELVGQAALQRVGGGNAEGVAVIAERSGESQLLVQARGLEPSGRESAYEVWLYNSQRDALSLGGQVTDKDGNLQGAGPLPANFRSYRFVDISREKIDRKPGNSGDSVLRIPMADLLRGRPTPGEAGGAPGAAP